MFLKLLFILSSILTIGSALACAMTKNLMHACIFLLGTLIGVAGLYVTLGADFVAATQVMVYVGGVVVLMLFAVMLTGGKDFISKAQKALQLTPNMGNKTSYALGFVSVAVFLLTIIGIFKDFVLTESFNEYTPFVSTVESIGVLLVSEHVLAFEISSVLLLGALIGAAIIARPKKTVEED